MYIPSKCIHWNSISIIVLTNTVAYHPDVFCSILSRFQHAVVLDTLLLILHAIQDKLWFSLNIDITCLKKLCFWLAYVHLHVYSFTIYAMISHMFSHLFLFLTPLLFSSWTQASSLQHERYECLIPHRPKRLSHLTVQWVVSVLLHNHQTEVDSLV